MMIFKDRRKVRCTLYFFVVVFGVGVILLAFIKNSQYAEVGYPHFEYLFSIGFALLFIGLLKLKKNVVALVNKSKGAEIEIEEMDERNRMLAYKSGYFAFVISVLLLFGSNLYFLFVESPLFEVSSYVCCFILTIYVASYFVIRRIN